MQEMKEKFAVFPTQEALTKWGNTSRLASYLRKTEANEQYFSCIKMTVAGPFLDIAIVTNSADGTAIEVQIPFGFVGSVVRSDSKQSSGMPSFAGTFQEFKEKAEAEFIKSKLQEFDWNISRTAKSLDIQRGHLYNKMKKYGLDRGEM